MELWMGRLKYKYANEISKANNTSIRQFLVPDQYDFKQPKKDMVAGEWLPVNQKNILDFSGVAYFFAKEINAQYHVPIGIINSALGGSPAQAWISEEGLKAFPEYLQETQKFKDDAFIKQIETGDQKVSAAWYNYVNTFDEGILQKWSNEKLQVDSWNTMNLPGYWADNALGNTNGVVWFRKTINVPKSMTGINAKLELGRIVDADSVFVNGKFVGTTGYQYPPRRYELENNVLKEGENTIAIRVISNAGRGGFVLDKKYELTTSKDTIHLDGPWKCKLGISSTSLPGQTFVRWKPAGLYNAMMAPLTKFSIKGFLWYQGESNAGNPDNYDALMQSLIYDWRSKWNQNNLPFIYVQLPNFMEASTVPKESQWANLRQQQFNTLKVPNTSMAVAIDLGDWNDIHPENKLDVGHRLALLARKNVYGEKKLVAQGPIFTAATIKNEKIIISFSEIGSGLIAKDNKALGQFQIAGADKKFVWASATIVNNQVVVWNDTIHQPLYVRYAWADNPQGANLYNKEGLPAAPFTTLW
jgi:sialate O-acetylesterase